VIIAHTVKGKGVSFMENNADWHGKAPDHAQMEKALAEIMEGF
ncbi:MAG: transketolase, partial [Synergistaceae bacterium]|nr:transketolase [Synergistaceae bacterium]